MKNKTADIILALCEEQEMTQSELAYRLGEIKQTFSQRMLKTTDFKLSKFVEVVETLGYKLELKRTDIFRITEECAMSIVVNKQPDGYYWSQKSINDLITSCTATICKDGQVTQKKFNDKADCLAWLEDKKYQDAK